MRDTVIIAEKPSVASGIARIVGADTPRRQKANGYLEGNGYKVTWAFGHLVGLVSPEALGFGGDTLPIMPEEWKTDIIHPSKSDMAATIKRQMEIIGDLFRSAKRIIVATDAGREGELIFRYIYESLGCDAPFDRLWISSLTDEAIRAGLDNLRPGRDYDSLSDAAHARSEADWLLGYNASRALRVSSGYKGNLSLGRVQTPVLKMICDRFEANRTFVPTPYWQVRAVARKGLQSFTVTSVDRFASEADAGRARDAAASAGAITIIKVETRDVTTRPPLLHDLTSLQREANAKLGLTADETLKIAQRLYESRHLTYPRTGSRYIPEDIYRTLPPLIARIECHERFTAAAAALEGKRLCRRSVNDEKVTDHHALLPTPNIPENLTGAELAVWEMVCGRLLEAVGEDSVSKRTTVEADGGGTAFKATGSTLVKAGWKSVLGAAGGETTAESKTDRDDEEPDQTLPRLTEGETLPAEGHETVRKTDKPLPIYTDSSLLGEMETCGKKIDDEELRETMKDLGLGTPATRAQTIETLIARRYVERKGKKLLPTDLGLAVWRLTKDLRVADVRTSGEWERDLTLVERGKKRKAEFDEGIRQFTLEVIKDIKDNCPSLGDTSPDEPARICPLCGKPMANRRYDILCDPSAGGCGLRVGREVAGKRIPVKAIDDLCSGRATGVIKGFKSKSGKTFEARLRIDPEKRSVAFDFGQPQTIEGRICPCCGRPLTDGRWTLTCECGLSIQKCPGGVTMDQEQIDTLLSGKAVHLKGMRSKTGKTYGARLTLNTREKKIDYVFDSKTKRR